MLCEHWDWRHPNEQLKGMACCALLLKLEEKKLVNLPPPLATRLMGSPVRLFDAATATTPRRFTERSPSLVL
ncbi:hypothetical protein TRIP_B330558 [uncultured Desulfatiglans sp.]|uniref:Uncharacterized protein n=1 Tax=Uncultured Desulfatiglans sp. TaxID=1748965 RepID=A0A653A9X4_UNCDX|nr:hypothetical protein TRIP_B330558 [uncultured Desulfatiglans sp.]